MKLIKRFHTLFSILALVLMASPANAAADQLEHAVQAYHANQYQKAYELMLPLAQQGESEAQFYLGGMLVDGLGIKADTSQGVYWLEQAVGNQHALAAQTLGNMYLSGHGVAMDAEKAAYYITLFDQTVNKEDVEVECD
jgi:TPR repeat protein